jgi:hypothetical protein
MMSDFYTFPGIPSDVMDSPEFNDRRVKTGDYNPGNAYRWSHNDISRGYMPGAYPVIAYGERVSAGAESEYPIWPDGPIKSALAGGIQLYVRSTSANDVLGSTGISYLSVHYINGDGDEIAQTVPLNGVARVPLTVPGRFVQCMHIGDPGQGYAAGTIYCDDGTDAGIYSQIGAGQARCSSSFRMVPRGKVLYIDGAVGSSISGTADAKTRMRLVSNSIYNHLYEDPLLFIPVMSVGISNVGIAANFAITAPLPEFAVVGGTHTTDKAATVGITWWGRIEPAESRGPY